MTIPKAPDGSSQVLFTIVAVRTALSTSPETILLPHDLRLHLPARLCSLLPLDLPLLTPDIQ